MLKPNNLNPNNLLGESLASSSFNLGASHDELSPLGHAKKSFLSSLFAANKGKEGKARDYSTEESRSAVTQTVSLVVSHILAPLWSIEVKPNRLPDDGSLFHTSSRLKLLVEHLDRFGCDLNSVTYALASSEELTTMFLSLCAAQLLLLEQKGVVHTFAQCAEYLTRESARRQLTKSDSDDPSAYPNDVPPNDEIATLDQQRRKITRVGGDWKPHGVRDLHPRTNAHRVHVLHTMLWTSLMHRYDYMNEDLTTVLTDYSSHLFLITVTENLLTLCSGAKGPNYVAKYLVFLCRNPGPLLFDDNVVPPSHSLTQSHTLQFGVQAVLTALLNLCHRNDVGEVILQAMCTSFSLIEERQVPQLIALIRLLLRHAAIPYHCMGQLMEAMHPCLILPRPAGTEAMQLMRDISAVVRCADANLRGTFASVLVFGNQLGTFKRQQVYVLINTHCTRGFLVNRIHWGHINMQRRFPRKGFYYEALPLARKENHLELLQPESATLNSEYTSVDLTDEVLTACNLVINVFQYIWDLHFDSPTECPIKIQLLYSIPPSILAQYYPAIHHLLSNANFGDAPNTDRDTLGKIMGMYNRIIAENGTRSVQTGRHRLEAPWTPMLDVAPILLPEEPCMPDDIRDKVWTEVLEKIVERETNWVTEQGTVGPEKVHPKPFSRMESTRHVVRLAIGGGGWTIQSLLTALLLKRAEQKKKDRSTTEFLIYPLPWGYDNVLATWLEQHDPTYGALVYFPIVQQEYTEFEAPTQSSLDKLSHSSEPPESLESGRLRTVLDTYFSCAKQKNRVLVYRIEAVRPALDANGRFVNRNRENNLIIPFVAFVEIGSHLQGRTASATSPVTGHGGSLQQNLSLPYSVSDRRGSSVDVPKSPLLPKSPRPTKHRTSMTETYDATSRKSMSAKKKKSIFADKISDFSDSTAIINNTSMSSETGRDGTFRNRQAAFDLAGHMVILSVDQSVTADRLLALLSKSLPLKDNINPSDKSQILRYTCLGSEVVGFFVSTFNLRLEEARSAASKCLDLGLIIYVSGGSVSGRNEHSIVENGFYNLRERNDTDTCVATPVTSSNANLMQAMAVRSALERPGGPASPLSSVPTIGMRVVYTPRTGVQAYKELSIHAQKEQNIQYLCVKNIGRPGDRGLLPNPLSDTLQMFVYDGTTTDRKGRPRATCDVGEHYQIRGTLDVESKQEFMMCVDGEILGPFVKATITPYWIHEGEAAEGTHMGLDVMSFQTL